MAERIIPCTPREPGGLALETYDAELSLASLVIGVDNIHHDVYLSPQWSEQTKTYLLELLRQHTNLAPLSQNDPRRPARRPDTSGWKKQLAALLETSLTRAKYHKNIEMDLLLRIALLKFLTQEIGTQFSNLLLEGKEWIRGRGEYFERTGQAHILKARLAELQADRRNIFRHIAQHIRQILAEMEENQIGRARQALFGEEQSAAYEMLLDPILFTDGGRDDVLFLEQYVLLGNYARDPDRFEILDALLTRFFHDFSGAADLDRAAGSPESRDLFDSALAWEKELARLEEERGTLAGRLERGGGVLARVGLARDASQTQASLEERDRHISELRSKLELLQPRLQAARAREEVALEQQRRRTDAYLNEPSNARRLLDPDGTADAAASREERARRLDEWTHCLERENLLIHILASYELRNLYRDFCPPVHLQQLKKALVDREEFTRVTGILKQFPARRFPFERIEARAKKLRRYPREETRAIVLRFTEDFLRLRRDRRNYERLTAAMERVHLVRSERTRELSRLNHSLYEFLLPSELESRPAEDAVVGHAVIKADVRGSTRITQDLLARGLNPATLFSLNFYEPVTRILERYSAAKVFIEGDAMILGIFETESNRARQRAVSKACALGRQILAIAESYNTRPETSALPRLELGVGIAFQGSAPAYWVDGNSRIMISRALNLSDRLSSCSKLARRLLEGCRSCFRLFIFQPGVEGAAEEEADEFLIRFNRNGIELNEEGFAKLSEELALQSFEAECEMPWGRERTQLFFGELPLGESLEPILLRQGFVRHLLPDGRIGAPAQRAYYEVCADPRAFELVEALHVASSTRAY